ncbi:helix-turn-helix domain-containing protein [Alishewanella sp. 16-MA]|uniref:Helix-turn-helix domain-containing protein n=1 Tax=Alishewanella maricola TaxID=2795740 RepID=A0ABS8C1L7_9ALTE|nr:helix-turn-helix domain-containing protein [Alishewanella maricola]MCB5226227.1 helix-turn-helix domain-containing protein [Alishewanella maricola]
MKTLTIQQKLQQLLERGLSPKDLAEKIGCHISTVYRIRDGFITDPSYSVGQAIDNLLAEKQANAA